MLRQLFKGLFLTIPSLLSANDCWVEVEYLGWTSKETSLPIPLVTTASFVDPIPGAIGQPNTRTLLGQQTLSSQWQNGFRIDVGTWMFPECGAGFESNYFLMPTYTQNKRFFTSGEVGSPNFAVPIFDTTGVFGLNGIAGQTVFILPGPIGGTAGFEGLFNLSVSHQFQGAELDYIYIVGTNGCFGLDGSIGIEWIQLKESLTFQGATHTAIGSSFGSNFYNFQDTFKTDNNFVGGTIGFKTLFEKWNGSIETGIKLGIGVTNERVSIHGTSQTAGGNLFFLTSGTASDILPGGVFAQASNIGTFDHRIFATTLEANIRLGYHLFSFLELTVGYRFFWLKRVVRPGNQMDRNINTTLTALANASHATVGTGPGPVPFGAPAAAPAASGTPDPLFRFNQSNTWTQSLTAGLTVRF